MVWQPWTPGDGMPRMNKSLVYLGACVIAGLRLARERQVHVAVVPTMKAIEESVDLSYELFTQVFRRAAKHVEELEDDA